jgi:predicted membrane-bound mannosyltransferase
VVELVRARSGGVSLARTPLLAALRAPGLDAWVWGLCAFALSFTVLFTTFLVHPQGLRDGVYKSLSYWLSQHEVERGDQPHFFYLVLLGGYELPIVLLGAWGAVAVVRRRALSGALLIWMFGLSMVVYSWAGERMPWLVLHPLLPLILLAGFGAQDLWRRRGRAGRAAAAAGAVAGAAFLVHGSVAAAYRHPADPAELLVFTQTSVQLEPTRDRIFELDRAVVKQEGRHPTLHVDSWGGTAWPWGWYFRDLPVFYADMSDPAYTAAEADVIVVAELNQPRLAPFLRSHEGTRFLLREWWVVDYDAASPRDLLNWLIHRHAWSVKGTMGEWLYVRKGLVTREEATRQRPQDRVPKPSTDLPRADEAASAGAG